MPTDCNALERVEKMHDKLKSMIQEYIYYTPLDASFTWDFSLDALPSTVVNLLPNNSAFHKNVVLKSCLRSHMKSNGYSIEYWLIQTWGGIQGFKKNDKNDQRIAELYESLDKGSLSRDLFGCISSLSKVASFYNPGEYSIYDSRAIFSLNWLLLKSGATDSFFPMPAGRNTEITKYDIETIVRLKCGEKNGLFLEHKTAYFKYCALLKMLSLETWHNEERKNMPFYLEMLLFVLAPQMIVEDIKKSTRVDVQ